MNEVKTSEFSSIFDKVSKEWMLVSATSNGKTNTMTASWGGFGEMWFKDVAFVFIRPQRYTKELIDNSEYFTLSFFDEKYRDMLMYMGTKSGRDEDKIKNQNLTVDETYESPCFKEATFNLVCKKLYAQDLTKEGFIDKAIIDKCYKDNDYHVMYVVSIEKVLKN